jgi:hypothetical protein
MRRFPVLATIPLIALLAQGSALGDSIIDAAKRGDVFAVKHYLRKFPDSITASDKFEYTPLDWAGIRGEWEVFEALVEAGAPVDTIGFDGGNPLHRAAHHDRPDMVRLLLDRGSDISLQNRWGRTPLHVAARRGCDLVVALLLSRGADPDATTKEGWTPLHVAYKSGHPRVIELLLSRGANPDRKDKDGNLPATFEHRRPEPIAVDPANLHAYIGHYGLSPEVAAEVWLENGRLYLAEFGPNELYPIGPDTFYCRREPWKVTFHRASGEAVDRVEIDFLRRTVQGKRLSEYEYVGSKVCGECHLRGETGDQYVTWMKSSHGRAYWDLKTEWAKFLASIREEYSDIEEPAGEWRCLKCHVTGAQDFINKRADGFLQEEGVGCEACHGPGSAYIDPEVMADRELFLQNGGRLPGETTCRTCHEDDRFHFDERLPQITHPRPQNEEGAADS